MQPEDRDTWFWTLSELGDSSPRAEEPIPDETLEAYRSGQLTEDELHKVEQMLVANPRNRRRLLELAGMAPEAPSAILRRRVLEGKTPPRRARPIHRGWLGLAAAAVLGVALGWMLLGPANTPPAYEVRIEGLTEFRGPEVQSDLAMAQAATARAETTVVIDATVASRALEKVEVALYRAVDGHLEQVVLGDESVRRDRPGAVRFKAPASALVGKEPGLYEIFVVIAWQGELPAPVVFGPGDDPVELLGARGKRRVHRLTLRLLAETSAIPPPASGPPSDEENQHVAHWIGSVRNSYLSHPQRFGRCGVLGTL